MFDVLLDALLLLNVNIYILYFVHHSKHNHWENSYLLLSKRFTREENSRVVFVGHLYAREVTANKPSARLGTLIKKDGSV